MAKPKHPAEESAADSIARLQKESARWKAKANKWRAEADKWKEEAKHLKAEYNGLFGIDDDGDECFEDQVVRIVRDTRRIGDIKLNTFTGELRSFEGNDYPMAGIGKCVVLLDINETLRLGDIARFADITIPQFKQDFVDNIKRKSVKGAIIYRRLGGTVAARQKVAADALSRGIILLRAIGINQIHQIKTPAEVSIPARQLKPAAK